VPRGLTSFAARASISDHHDLGLPLNRVLAGDEPPLEALLAKIRPYLHVFARQKAGRLGQALTRLLLREGYESLELPLRER